MNNNYTQRLEMQIPHENTYTGLSINKNFDDQFDKLSKNYKIHRINQVNKFIKSNPELLDYIAKITPMINKFFSKHLKCITFFEDYEFEELNNITIFITSSDESFDEDCKKFDELEIEIIRPTEFTKNVKQLVSMDLWII